MQQAVADDGRECLLLDGGRPELDAVEHRGVENVDSGVDAVADELDGLLDETIDSGRMIRLVNDDAVFGGLLNLGHDYGAFVAVGLVEGGQLFERVFAGDVGVEDKEGRIVFSKSLFGKFQGASSAQRLILDREGNSDIKPFFILKEKRKVQQSAKEKKNKEVLELF